MNRRNSIIWLKQVFSRRHRYHELSFEFPLEVGRLNQAKLWVPMSLTAEELSDESVGFWGCRMVARLKEGVILSQAAQDADRVSREIMRAFSPSMSKTRIRGDVKLLSEVLTGDTKPLLRVLLVAVCVVLMIVCANVAILMLVRAVRRHREHALRLALGARPGAILRGSILEGLLLSLCGGFIGLVFAAIDGLPDRKKKAAKPAFVELIADLSATMADCLIEFESSVGSKMRIQ